MFDWGEFLSQAQRLAAGGDEAGYRSSISRAYYSVFGLARRRLRDVERLPVPNTGQTWSCYVLVWLQRMTGGTCAEYTLPLSRVARGKALWRASEKT